MKVYISVDMEGICSTANWDEVNREKMGDYPPFKLQMTRETVAACEGALLGGAKEITIKDAHASARNIDPESLPVEAQMIRGWSGHPYMMVDQIDSTYSALILIGYHSRAGSAGNPMAHTLSYRRFSQIKINSKPISEFYLNRITALTFGVPTLFVSGDGELCQEIFETDPQVQTLAVKWGTGAAVRSIQPELARDQIKLGVSHALKGRKKYKIPTLPSTYNCEVTYQDFMQAYRASFFPRAIPLNPQSIGFTSPDWMDILRFLHFT